MRTILFFIFSFFLEHAIGQTFSLKVKQIDSIAIGIDSSKNVIPSFVDGMIISKHKGIFSLFKKKRSGSFSDDYFFAVPSKTLVKLSNETSLKLMVFTEYYFNNDSLVLVKTHVKDFKGLKPERTGLFYFSDNVLIKKTGNDNLSKAKAFVKIAQYYSVNGKSMMINLVFPSTND